VQTGTRNPPIPPWVKFRHVSAIPTNSDRYTNSDGILISSFLASLTLKWWYKLQNIKKESEKSRYLLCYFSSSPLLLLLLFLFCLLAFTSSFLVLSANYYFFSFSLPFLLVSFSFWFKCRRPFTCFAIWLLKFQVSTIHFISFCILVCLLVFIIIIIFYY
jgi:hypothetical protein